MIAFQAARPAELQSWRATFLDIGGGISTGLLGGIFFSLPGTILSAKLSRISDLLL
jgi:hypothetical protein